MCNDFREFSIFRNIDQLLPKVTGPKRIYYCNMCLYLCLCSLCVTLRLFHVLCTICKYLGLVVTMLFCMAALLTLSTKDLLSHLFTTDATWWYGNLLPKRHRFVKQHQTERNVFMVKEKKFSIFFCKRCIAQRRENLIGTLNGDIRLFLQLSQALGLALPYCSTTIFNFKFWNISPIPKGRLSLQT